MLYIGKRVRIIESLEVGIIVFVSESGNDPKFAIDIDDSISDANIRLSSHDRIYKNLSEIDIID